jgi:hypothetical protein
MGREQVVQVHRVIRLELVTGRPRDLSRSKLIAPRSQTWHQVHQHESLASAALLKKNQEVVAAAAAGGKSGLFQEGHRHAE